MNLLRAFGLLAAATFLACLPAMADTTYSYTGGLISGSFSLSSPLGDNMAETPITPDSFSFTDGSQVFTDSTVTSVFGNPSSGFSVGTDSTGNINVWYIWATNAEFNWFTTENDQYGSYERSYSCDSGSCGSAGSPGNWQVTNTPEPSSLLMLSSGLIGLGFFRKRTA